MNIMVMTHSNNDTYTQCHDEITLKCNTIKCNECHKYIIAFDFKCNAQHVNEHAFK